MLKNVLVFLRSYTLNKGSEDIPGMALFSRELTGQ